MEERTPFECGETAVLRVRVVERGEEGGKESGEEGTIDVGEPFGVTAFEKGVDAIAIAVGAGVGVDKDVLRVVFNGKDRIVDTVVIVDVAVVEEVGVGGAGVEEEETEI